MVIAFLMMNPFHHKFRRGMPTEDMGGEFNGYVAFDAELPGSWQGSASFDDDNVLDHMVNVHGGITLDCSMEYMINDQMIPLPAMPAPEELKKYRCIGFDTLHCGDTKEKWPEDAVKAETIRLMEQIEKLLEK